MQQIVNMGLESLVIGMLMKEKKQIEAKDMTNLVEKRKVLVRWAMMMQDVGVIQEMTMVEREMKEEPVLDGEIKTEAEVIVMTEQGKEVEKELITGVGKEIEKGSLVEIEAEKGLTEKGMVLTLDMIDKGGDLRQEVSQEKEEVDLEIGAERGEIEVGEAGVGVEKDVAGLVIEEAEVEIEGVEVGRGINGGSAGQGVEIGDLEAEVKGQEAEIERTTGVN